MSTGVFVSYAQEDLKFVELIHERFNAEGIDCWAAYEDTSAGESYLTEIENAIENSDLLIVLVSDNAIKSDWVRKEVETAAALKKKIIPFYLQDVQLKNGFRFVLGEIHAIKVLYLPWGDQINLLVEAIQRHLNLKEVA